MHKFDFFSDISNDEDYYGSLKTKGIPDGCFAGDMMHYLLNKELIQNKTILDAGTGAGYGAYHLALEGAKKVIGVDISESSVRTAHSNFKLPNLTFMTSSICHLPFSHESFDLIVSYEVIEHVTKDIVTSFMNEVSRLLKPDGILIISTPNRDVYSWGNRISITKGHINELSVREFCNLIRKYFHKYEFFYQHKYEYRQFLLGRLNAKYIIARITLKLTRMLRRIYTSMRANKTRDTNDSLSLLDHMNIWSIYKAASIDDLKKSIIQIAVCRNVKDTHTECQMPLVQPPVSDDLIKRIIRRY